MANNFYSHTDGVPVTNARGVSATTRAEFDLIASGFDIVQNYAVDTGTANAMVIAPPTALVAFSDGLRFRIKAANATSGATTVNCGTTLGTVSLKRSDGTAITSDIKANDIFDCAYSTTYSCLVLIGVMKNYVDQLAFSTALPAQSLGFLSSTGSAASFTKNLTFGLNDASATVASAASPDIWAALGNVISYTGTATCTGFPAAPQAGARRHLVCTGAAVFTAGANMLINGVSSGSNYTAAANDQIYVLAITTTQFLLMPVKYNGQSVAQVGSGGTTATGNVTLTVSSPAAQVITPAAPGYYATLPDATTCTKAATLYIVSNAGEYDYGIKNSAGTQLGWIRPGQTCVIGLGDNSTTAGSWACSSLEKTGITAQLFNTSATNTATSGIQRITIDATRTAFVFGGTSCYVVVYDSSQAAGSQWGTVTLVRSSIASGAFLSILSGASQILVVSSSTTTGMEAVTITLTGGTGVTINSGTKGTATLAGNWASFGQLIAAGTSWCVSYGRDTTTSAIREITVSGTTPTISSEAALVPAVTTSATLYAVTSTVVLTLSTDATSLNMKPFTLQGNGTAPSAGTAATQTVTAAGFRSLALGSGRWCILCVNTTTFGMIVSVSSTTATKSSISLGGSAITNANSDADMIAVSSTKVCVCYNAGSTAFSINNIVDNAGTINVGTAVATNVTGNCSSGQTAAISVSSNTALFSIKTASTAYSAVVDASAASAVLTNLIPILGGATNVPILSDQYGVKSPRTLIAGGAGYAVPSTTINSYVTRFSTSGVQLHRPPNLLLMTSTNGVSGASNSESWFVDANGNSTTGVCISHMEAAA